MVKLLKTKNEKRIFKRSDREVSSYLQEKTTILIIADFSPQTAELRRK